MASITTKPRARPNASESEEDDDRLFKLGEYLVWMFFFIFDLLKLLAFTIWAYLEALFRLVVPPAPKSVAGERILITGAGNGIGREICLQLARSGATLICWDIDKGANETLVRDLKGLGAKAYGYVVDISDRIKVEAAASKGLGKVLESTFQVSHSTLFEKARNPNVCLERRRARTCVWNGKERGYCPGYLAAGSPKKFGLEEIKADIGDVTIVINNAAIMPVHPFLGHNPRELERLFQINVLGQFWILREFLPPMMEKNKGHIVTTCSIAGLIGTRHMVPYCGTKAAVHCYIEALKNELRHIKPPPNIHFTTVYPFAVNTALTANVKCHTNFPSLYSVLQPQDVAARLIDGMRRNYEHVYVPRIMNAFGMLFSTLLPKVNAAAADFFDGHVEPTQ